MFSALSTFPDSEDLVIPCFRALGNLGLRNETTQQVLVTDGLLELTVKIMEHFKNTQKYSCMGHG